MRIQRLPLTATVLLAAIGMAAPSFAQQAGAAGNAAAPAQTGATPQAGATPQTSTTPQAGNEAAGHEHAAAAETGRVHRPEAYAERQLARLHRELDITTAQEAAWTKFKDATIADARNIGQLYRERAANFEKMNAVDNLKDYQKILQTQADGLGSKVAAFATLYDSLSPEQKETADRIFRYKSRRAEQRHMASMRRHRGESHSESGATESGTTTQQ